MFLESSQGPGDLWEEANGEIAAFLRNEPTRVRRLMESPLESLNPTDQLVRGFVLEEHKDFRQARIALQLANEGMYAPGFRSAWKSQVRFVKERLTGLRDPVVDLATGMGSLLEIVLPATTHQFVATDVSPRVLLRDKQAFDALGLGSQLSFLAFDARHPPFAGGSVPTLITNVGLANIESPGALLRELRRVVRDEFMAISLFYPEEEGPNSEMIHRLKLDPLMFRSSALQQFEEAGFSVRVHNSQKVTARPTPKGEIMSEVQPDRLPVVETEVEWCTLVAN